MGAAQNDDLHTRGLVSINVVLSGLLVLMQYGLGVRADRSQGQPPDTRVESFINGLVDALEFKGVGLVLLSW